MRLHPIAFLIANLFLLTSFIAVIKFPETSFKIDTKQSTVVWTGKKVTGSHTGNIQITSGALESEGKILTGGNVTINMASITCTDLTNPDYNQKLVEHLNNDDFFATSKHPVSHLKITKAALKQGSAYELTGLLSIKGVTNEVTFPATVNVTDKTISAVGTVTVDRTKYDIKYGSGSFFENLGDKAIDNNFTLDFNLTASK